MDQIEQDLSRFKQPAVAFAGGIAAALVIATLPHVYLENIVGATGLSEIVPAAAPPLGNTARGLITLVVGMITASTLYLILNQKTKTSEGGSDMGLAIRKNLTSESTEIEREGKSRFAVPKLNLSVKSLTRFLKKPKKSPGQVTELKDLPDIRSADRHPDAPARQPIFASSDLGVPLAEKIKQFDQPMAETASVEPLEQVAQPPVMPEAVGTGNEVQSQFEEHAVQQRPEPVLRSESPLQKTEAAMSNVDLSGLSLAQLAERLEAGLERLDALRMREREAEPFARSATGPIAENADSPAEVAETPAPVSVPPLRSIDSVDTDRQDSRQADMDAALKAALGTLERMTVHR